MWIIVVAGCGTWWVSSLFGWWDWAYIIYDGPYPCENQKCSGYNATRDGPWHMEKIDWANFAIQMVRGCLTYQGLVMVGPWRFSNLWHLTCSRRESSKGHDFYGRQVGDDAVWYQIDAPKRLKITLFLVGNIFFQCLLQVLPAFAVRQAAAAAPRPLCAPYAPPRRIPPAPSTHSSPRLSRFLPTLAVAVAVWRRRRCRRASTTRTSSTSPRRAHSSASL